MQQNSTRKGLKTMEIFTLLETLEDMLEKSRNVPFSGKCVVDKEEILDIIKEIRLKLPEELKEIAVLREKNPNATLEELGKLLKNPIGKSSVSHRFKKIEEYL